MLQTETLETLNFTEKNRQDVNPSSPPIDDEMSEKEIQHDLQGQAEKQKEQTCFIREKQLKSHSKKRTLEDYIITPELQVMADEITKKARVYKVDFSKIEELCDKDLKLPGPIALMTTAVKVTKDSTENSFNEINIPEVALQAANSYLNMQESITALTGAGIPVQISLELTRRVLDAEIPNSETIVVRAAVER